MAGKGWYSRMREKLAGALGEHHEMFAQLLGATSAKTPVRNNFIQALDALEQFKEGKFDGHVQKYLEAYEKMKEGKGALSQYMKEQGIHPVDDDGNPIDKHASDADAMAHWIGHHNILPLQKNGSKYNANSEAVLKVLAGTWLKEVDAPKTPNFAGNLTGRTLEATIDVWAARHLQRLGYEGLTKGKPWRAQAAAEPGVNSLDFAFSQDAMRHAADKLGINPDDLQAILWFAEKHHYENKGWTRGQGAEKGSFDDVADLAFPKSGKSMTSDELRAHYSAMQEAAAQRKGRVETARGQLAREDWPRLGRYVMEHELTPEEVYGGQKEQEPEGYQRGGHVSPTSTDTVPAMLTPGEFVVNRNAVQAIGPQKLEALNRAIPDIPGLPGGYQPGGQVPSEAQHGAVYRAMAYGPSQGEYTHDTLFGHFGKLQMGDMAISPNLQSQFPMGSIVNVVDPNTGQILRANRRVADSSYAGGKPTTNSFELWNDDDLGHARLELASGGQPQQPSPVGPGMPQMTGLMSSPAEQSYAQAASAGQVPGGAPSAAQVQAAAAMTPAQVRQQIAMAAAPLAPAVRGFESGGLAWSPPLQPVTPLAPPPAAPVPAPRATPVSQLAPIPFAPGSAPYAQPVPAPAPPTAPPTAGTTYRLPNDCIGILRPSIG